MLVEPLDQRFGVEELLRGLALELLLDDVVELLVTQPYARRHGEAELFLLGGRLGHVAHCRLAHRVLGVVLVDAQLGRQRRRDLEHLFVEERHAQLERIRHTHAVSLEQNVADHPHIDVEVLHLGDVVRLAAAEVIFLRVRLRRGRDGGILQNLLFLAQVVHKGVADVAVLEPVAGADQIIPALDVGQMAADRADRSSEKMRNDFLVHAENARVVVAGIAAEQFIGALSREHDLDIVAGKTGDKVQRNTGRVGKRLIHIVLHGRHRVPEFIARDQMGMVLDADFAAQLLRPADFVILLTEVKADGEGFLVCKVSGDVAGIHARGQEASDLDVRDLVRVDGVLKHLLNAVDRLFLGERLVGLEARLEVAVGLDLTALVPEIVTGHQAEYVLKEGLGRYRVLEGKVGVQRASVEALDELGVLENTLDLAGVDELALNLRVVHGLDAEEVARDKDALVDGVVDSEAEHASELEQQILTPFLKAVNQHLAVGVGIEAVTALDQLFTQLLVVVNLAVKGENKRFILIVDGLMSGVQIND